MVLVASETGHVYTYSTDKFKPLLNSQQGRKLIRTCLADKSRNDSGEDINIDEVKVNELDDHDISYDDNDPDNRYPTLQRIDNHGSRLTLGLSIMCQGWINPYFSDYREDEIKEDGPTLIEINEVSHIDESYDDSSHESSHKRTNDESSQNHFVNSRITNCPQVSHTSIRPALRNQGDELQSTSNTPQREQLLIRSRAAGNPVNVVFQPIQSQGQPRLQPDPGQRSSQGQTQGHIWERGGGQSDEQFPVKYIQSNQSNQSYQNNPANHFNPSIRLLGPGGGQLRSAEVNGTHLFRPPRPKDERTILQRR